MSVFHGEIEVATGKVIRKKKVENALAFLFKKYTF